MEDIHGYGLIKSMEDLIGLCRSTFFLRSLSPGSRGRLSLGTGMFRRGVNLGLKVLHLDPERGEFPLQEPSLGEGVDDFLNIELH